MISVPARRLLFWAAATFAFIMAVVPHPPELPGEPNDKIQHMLAFAMLGLLAAWAYGRAPIARLLIGLSLYGAFIEMVQAIPSLHRDSDIKDWLADTIACAVVLAAVGLWRSRSRSARNMIDRNSQTFSGGAD